jgi:anti-sigma B factor antagonist
LRAIDPAISIRSLKERAEMILKFTKRELEPGLAVLEIQGNIHCGPECARLERQVDEMIAANEIRLIFDMAGVTHMDSAAIGSIVRSLSKLKQAGGGMRIAGAQSMIDYSLRLTKVDKIIEMFSTVEEARLKF